jgi:hypothetical protein
MSVVACPPAANNSLVKFLVHESWPRPRFPQCLGAELPLRADATALDLHTWHVALLRQLLLRRRMTQPERQRIRATLGDRWFRNG